MKFKPILFSSNMVNAILEGRKTQTRRVVKGQPLKWLQPEMFTPDFVAKSENALCPFGIVGDVLWVRETFTKSVNPNEFIYKSDCDNPFYDSVKWKPSIFMPKEACRIFLKIKSIKVERLRSITNNDAISEGIESVFNSKDSKLFRNYLVPGKDKQFSLALPYNSFSTLWEKINGLESWNENPWVWVIEFDKIDKPENFK